MKRLWLIPMVVLFGGSCTTLPPIEAVIWEANQCVAYYSFEMDVPIAELPIELLRECWADADKRMDRLEARQNRQDREEVKNIRCERGLIPFCNDWGICSCMTYEQILRTLGR